jgi:hypothetical protein
MSVLGYFKKRDSGLKMPDSEKQPDSLGIRYEGELLNGKITVDEALAREKAQQQLAAAQTQIRTGVGCVRGPEEYDPVLRYHLRVGKPYYFLKEGEEEQEKSR